MKKKHVNLRKLFLREKEAQRFSSPKAQWFACSLVRKLTSPKIHLSEIRLSKSYEGYNNLKGQVYYKFYFNKFLKNANTKYNERKRTIINITIYRDMQYYFRKHVCIITFLYYSDFYLFNLSMNVMSRLGMICFRTVVFLKFE